MFSTHASQTVHNSTYQAAIVVIHRVVQRHPQLFSLRNFCVVSGRHFLPCTARSPQYLPSLARSRAKSLLGWSLLKPNKQKVECDLLYGKDICETNRSFGGVLVTPKPSHVKYGLLDPYPIKATSGSVSRCCLCAVLHVHRFGCWSTSMSYSQQAVRRCKAPHPARSPLRNE